MKKLVLLPFILFVALFAWWAQAEEEVVLQSVEALEQELVEEGISLDELTAIDDQIMMEFMAAEMGGEENLDGEFDILRRRPGMRPGRPGMGPGRRPGVRPGPRPGHRPGPIVGPRRPGRRPGPIFRPGPYPRPRPPIVRPRPWRPRPPLRPRPPRYPGYPTGPVTCYAENARGHVFEAWGYRPGIVQNRAMNECYTYSRMCYQMGCDGRGYF